MAQLSKISRNNTNVYTAEDGTRQVFLHQTCIVTTRPDRTVTFNNGGWATVTTQTRMNQVCNEWKLPFCVSRAGGAMRVNNRSGAKLATLHGQPVTLSY